MILSYSNHRLENIMSGPNLAETKQIPICIQAQYNKDILSIVEAKEDDTVLNMHGFKLNKP